MGDDFERVCKELDDMAIAMLRLMKDYIDVKVTLEELIKSGSLHLAKSRYIMGNRSVSVLQLPTEESSEFIASTRIVKPEDKDTEDKLCFELNKISLKDIPVSNVRSRNPKNKGDSPGDEDDGSHKELNIPDPLKWFGVLVPQNMRQAQSNFNKALEYIVQCANIQLEMERLQKQYQIKIQEKNKLRSKTVT